MSKIQIDQMRFLANSPKLNMNKKLSEKEVGLSLSLTLQPYFKEISMKRLIDVSESFDTHSNYYGYRFDYYLPTHRLIIEFDGRQHVKAVDHFGGQKEFNKQAKRDEIKEKFCFRNQISIIRMSHNSKVSDLDFMMRLFFKKGPGYYRFNVDKTYKVIPYRNFKLYQKLIMNKED